MDLLLILRKAETTGDRLSGQAADEIERLKDELEAIPEPVRKHWRGVAAVRKCGGTP